MIRKLIFNEFIMRYWLGNELLFYFKGLKFDMSYCLTKTFSEVRASWLNPSEP